MQSWKRLPAAPSVCPYTLLTETKAAKCSLMLCPVKAPPMAPTSAQSMQSFAHVCFPPCSSAQQQSLAKFAPASSIRWLVRAQSMSGLLHSRQILLGRQDGVTSTCTITVPCKGKAYKARTVSAQEGLAQQDAGVQQSTQFTLLAVKRERNPDWKCMCHEAASSHGSPMGSPRGVPVPWTAMPPRRSGSSSATCRVARISSR